VTSYDDVFYESNRILSEYSSSVIVSLVSRIFEVDSVVDFGCAQGTWLNEWKRHGAKAVFGLDGSFVDINSLVIEKDEFQVCDLSKSVALDRQFDLAESLEVAEHLPGDSAPIFVESITRHSGRVLFSAAPPGQGGVDHINEQNYEYWRDLFDARGYRLFDCIRPAVMGDTRIQPWYRYNTFLYVADNLVPTLPDQVLATEIGRHEPVEDISPAVYKMRKAVIRSLPEPVKRGLAHIKRNLISKKSAA
jgi:SAM-dependent methyltransferase